MATALFPQIDALLPWLPGETLFSLCSRHHRLWGHGLSERSTEIMFGRRRRGTQHDLPGGLDAFASRTEDQFGAVGEIARERTLLRYYRRFLDAPSIADAVAVMRGPNVAHLKFQLGLLTSRFRANHPLKACLECMREDLRQHGWVYWHLLHQYPGVWMCPRHRTPLRVSTVKSTGVERFQWSLPGEAQLVAAGLSEGHGSLEAHLQLTDLIVACLDGRPEDGWLHAEAVQRVLRSHLLARGWITLAGNVRWSPTAAGYLHCCALLRGPEELNLRIAVEPAFWPFSSTLART